MSNRRGDSQLRDFEFVLDQPIIALPRKSPRLPAPPRRRAAMDIIAGGAAICWRLAREGARLALSHKLASIFMLAFGWAGIVAGSNFLSQGKAHPRPLFAGVESQKARPATQVREGDIDDVINALAGLDPAGRHPVSAAAEKTSDVRSRYSAVQSELARIGMYGGAIDGVIGVRTEAAIRDYQQRAGLPVTGKATPALLQRLQREPRVPTQSTLDTRIDAPTITAVQKRLGDMAYYQGRVNGKMSQDTRTAVEKFQRDRAIKVSGDIDQPLLRELSKIGGPLR